MGLTALFVSVGCVYLILRLLRRGVIPSLVIEQSDAPSRLLWLDLWLPLIMFSPAAAMLAAAATGMVHFHPTLALAACVMTPAFAAMLSLGVVMNESHISLMQRRSGPTLAHALAILGVGTVVIIISLADRLPLTLGTVLFAACAMWMWRISPDAPAKQQKHPVAVRPADGSANAASSDSSEHAACSADYNTAARSTESAARSGGAFLVVDWSPPLIKPVSGWTRAGLLTAFAFLFIATAAIAQYWLFESIVCILWINAVLPAVAARKLGPANAARLVYSSLTISVLLGLGFLAISAIPFSLLPMMWARHESAIANVATQLPHMQILMPLGLLLVALALFVLSAQPESRRPEWFAPYAGLILMVLSVAGLISCLVVVGAGPAVVSEWNRLEPIVGTCFAVFSACLILLTICER